MIELKDKLSIPAGYFVEVGPVKQGGYNDELILQSMTIYRIEVRVTGTLKKISTKHHIEVYSDYIFLNEDGTQRYDDEVAFSDIRKKLRTLSGFVHDIKPVVRPGRHP